MLPPFNIYLTDGGSWRPVRVHSKKANGRKVSYHDRVQKKWNKRFGLTWIEIQKRGTYYMMGNHTLVIRRDDYPAYLEGIKNAAKIY